MGIVVVLGSLPFHFMFTCRVVLCNVNFIPTLSGAVELYALANSLLVIIPVANQNESRVVEADASALSSILGVYFSEVLPVLIYDLLKRLVCLPEA